MLSKLGLPLSKNPVVTVCFCFKKGTFVTSLGIEGNLEEFYSSVLDFWKSEFETFSENQVGQTAGKIPSSVLPLWTNNCLNLLSY